MKDLEELLSIPPNAAQNILKGNGIVARPLLSTVNFIRYCKQRDIDVDRKRLLNFERLGLFAPVFRVRTPEKQTSPLVLPLGKSDRWFQNGWAWNATKVPRNYEVPVQGEKECEAYYSVFQLFHLRIVLSSLTLSLHLEGLINQSPDVDWNKNAKAWTAVAESGFKSLSNHEFRPATALLCQYISDRYYFSSQTDQRSIQVTRGRIAYDQWLQHLAPDWDWSEYSRTWKPQQAEKLFKLTPKKLMHAFQTLSREQSFIDPLERWHQLVQFVSVTERQRLKGEALLAETLYSGAVMLRMLYKDLYGEDLAPPDETTGQDLKYIPRRIIRTDVRKQLEFVSNHYHLNPQPTMVLFVEGQSEEFAVRKIFEAHIGVNPGKYGIEIVCLKGVDNATGGKEDRFRAILRLIDYLHHHQTFTFLILDNENYATRLKNEARQAKSLHHEKRFITRPEYIKIWRMSFEFDNYSCGEISSALSSLTDEQVKFSSAEIEDCKKPEHCRNGKTPGTLLTSFYLQKTGHGLNKIRLNEKLLEAALSKKAKKQFENRPAIKILERVIKLACRNPLPTMQETWEKNQSSRYLAKKRKNAASKNP